jgi:hypothetical protein
MLKHLLSLFEYRSAATSGQSVLGWVTALSDTPLQGKMLIAAVGPRCCITSWGIDPMTLETLHVYILQKERILQLIVSGTLANAGRPERVKNKQKNKYRELVPACCHLQFLAVTTFFPMLDARFVAI